MDYKMSKFDIDRIACLMYRDIVAYIDDQRKQSSDCDAAARKEEKQDVLNPTSGDWEQRYLLPPHVEPKKENDHDESEQQ